MKREIVYFRIDETGMSWPKVPVAFTVDVTGLTFDEIEEYADSIAFKVCQIEQKIIRWNRDGWADGLGQGHYTDPWYVNLFLIDHPHWGVPVRQFRCYQYISTCKGAYNTMNQQFYQHQPVQTVAIPQADDQIRIWCRGENEQVRPQIIEGKVHSVSCFDDGSLQSILLWTNQGLQSIHWTLIGTIELA